MIESLGQHGIEAKDLVPPLMTTHTVANPEYDPAEARRQAELREEQAAMESADIAENGSDTSPSTPPPSYSSHASTVPSKPHQTTAKVFQDTAAPAMPGVSTHLSAADKDVTLDIRWTVLCDLFLVLIADSVYDARSRVLLESVALKMGLGWLDVVKFEARVTEALEIQESVEKMEQQESIQDVQKSSKKRRYMMLGLATLGASFRGICTSGTRLIRRRFCRRRSRHWFVRRSSCTCHWCGPRCCIHDHWHHWHNRIPRRRRRCGRHHNRRCVNGIWYRCAGHGTTDTICSNLRHSSIAQP